MTNTPPRLAGVMGWPIGHSLSPRLHGYWLQQYGINGHYVPLAVHPDNLPQALRALPALGFAGCNVTLPHKEKVFEAVDRLGETARRIGSVNTVVVEEDGSLTGHSTDGIGFKNSLLEEIPNFAPTKVLLLGAGGAARAVVDMLQQMGAQEIRLVNRTAARAEQLADELGGVQLIDWAERSESLREVNLVVNSTSLGLHGQPPLDMDFTPLPAGALAYDIVYNPLETAFLTAARAAGANTISGIGMLLHQAAPGFASWFGHKPSVSKGLRDHVLAGLSA